MHTHKKKERKKKYTDKQTQKNEKNDFIFSLSIIYTTIILYIFMKSTLTITTRQKYIFLLISFWEYNLDVTFFFNPEN